MTACVDNTVYFDQPQPEGLSDLKQLPIRYRGQYMDQDSTLLTITETLVIMKTNYEIVIKKSEIDSSKEFKFENNKLINILTNSQVVYRIKNDTFYIKENNIDTLFNLSNTNIARKYKGYLILNTKWDNSWSAECFSLTNGTLKQIQIESKELFNKLSAIYENEIIMDSTQTDTIKMILKPTKKQFKQILNIEDSLVINEYKKIK